jgi:outer membrane scaffolding protein for murein synthesis (MipA/OmpV family)
MIKPALFRVFLSLLFVLPGLPARGELKPEWELGAGVAAIDFPLYRGAAERRTYVLPTPYVQYRGKFLQVDRDRVRGLLFRSDRLEMDISVNGSVPVSSKDSSARQNMPDLDPTLELGPEMQVHLYYDERKHTNLDLRLPLRSVFAVNFGRFEHVGWIFHPKLNLDLRNVLSSGWNLGLQGGWIYGDRGYHGYFYDVAPQYATSQRPAYSASGGASGSQYIASLGRKYGDMWVGAFVKYDDLRGAVFEGSPLVQRREDTSVGFAVAWVFSKSEKLVEVSDD